MSNNNQDFRNFLLAMSIIMLFIFTVSFAIFFIVQNYSVSCDCKIPFLLILVSLTSLGVFVGIFTYYFLSKSFLYKEKKVLGNIEKTLNFLDSEERKILQILIKEKGKCFQSRLSKLTGISFVKLHRRLSQLESKNIILKEKNGMTNKIILEKDFQDIFLK